MYVCGRESESGGALKIDMKGEVSRWLKWNVEWEETGIKGQKKN